MTRLSWWFLPELRISFLSCFPKMEMPREDVGQFNLLIFSRNRGMTRPRR